MWCILWNIECCFLNFLGWATLIASITCLMNNTLHTMILNCFTKWCSMNRVMFLFDRRINKMEDWKTFSSLQYSNLWFFCHFLFDTSIKGKKKYQKKNKKKLQDSFLKSCFSLTETVVLLIRLAQQISGHSQAKIMNALGMKQVYMIVQITKNSV